MTRRPGAAPRASDPDVSPDVNRDVNRFVNPEGGPAMRRRPFRRLAVARLAAPLALLAFVPLACTPMAEEVETPPEGAPPLAAAAADSAAELAYRDAVSGPPAGWTGPVFALSHDYPTDLAPCAPDVCTWLGVDVDFADPDPQWDDWGPYLDAILAYVREGQDLSPEGWNTVVDGETRWYHVPWMAYDLKVGREFVHGFTNERTAYLSDFIGETGAEFGVHTLPGAEGDEFESWAVGMYNPWGGAAVGGSWGQDGLPRMAGDPSQPAGLPFPEGTLVAKILFTTATPEDVNYLEGSPEWTADRHVEIGGCDRAPQPVYLVQMDVAVVDDRSPTRWVYGTFGYNGTIDAASVWDRMSPIGLQWGNDPGSWPAVPESESKPIHESVIAPIDIYEHLGCGNAQLGHRLAGPVDNPQSACLACHAGGYAPRPAGTIVTMGAPPDGNAPPIFGFDGLCETVSQANADYFANRPFPEDYPGYPDDFNLDTSLQLQVAFEEYALWKTNGSPGECKPTTGAN